MAHKNIEVVTGRGPTGGTNPEGERLAKAAVSQQGKRERFEAWLEKKTGAAVGQLWHPQYERYKEKNVQLLWEAANLL